MEKKTDNIMKIVLIVIVVLLVVWFMYYMFSNMNKNKDNKLDVNNSVIENTGEEIKEDVKYTMESIENIFKDEKNMIKEEVDRMENDEYKAARKYKIGEDEFTVYEFDDDVKLEKATMEDKFKNMIRKGNLLIETTSDKIKNKINEITD